MLPSPGSSPSITPRRLAWRTSSSVIGRLVGDAVQSAWSIAWQRIGGLRDPSQVRAWLGGDRRQRGPPVAPSRPPLPVPSSTCPRASTDMVPLTLLMPSTLSISNGLCVASSPMTASSSRSAMSWAS